MITATDQNGSKLRKNVRRDEDGTWSANVWFGRNGATNLRRYYGYATRNEARESCISEVPAGGHMGEYEAAR